MVVITINADNKLVVDGKVHQTGARVTINTFGGLNFTFPSYPPVAAQQKHAKRKYRLAMNNCAPATEARERKKAAPATGERKRKKAAPATRKRKRKKVAFERDYLGPFLYCRAASKLEPLFDHHVLPSGYEHCYNPCVSMGDATDTDDTIDVDLSHWNDIAQLF